MHALPSQPKHPVVLAALALLVAMMLIAVSAPDLSSLDFSIGAEGASAGDAASSPATGSEARWVSDPLAAPVSDLAAAR